MSLYYWLLGATDHDTQFTEKQAYYERTGEILHADLTKTFMYAVELHGFFRM